jgi:retron-type reverse transcriptase
MTTPHYHLHGCSAGSKERGEASSSAYAGNPDDYAWIVNFNNGNVNWNNRHNHACVRAVRSVASPVAGEYQGAYERDGTVSLRSLYAAWSDARRGKRPSVDQLRFETRAIDELAVLHEQLNAGTWRPSTTTCFVATRPKAREIHAPSFRDRVAHHWLVPQLERLYERMFVHDSYANRPGKGTHAAVRRLESFVRQVHSGQGGGHFLQLDIHNFFNSIHRGTLYALLKRRMVARALPLPAQRATHALLSRSPTDYGVVTRATPSERALVPLHKRLDHAPKGCGLPIGNLSSQFFANVYLHELDAFVKHVLKARRYVRYVDDFVLVHESRDQLDLWRREIERFLASRLRLSLKPDIKLRPLTAGIDFLGYVVRPRGTLVRDRVVRHARAALRSWQQAHVGIAAIRATPAAYRRVASIWGSYRGHFLHARARRLQADFHRRFPWLAQVAERRLRFDYRAEGRVIQIRRASCSEPSKLPRNSSRTSSSPRSRLCAT